MGCLDIIPFDYDYIKHRKDVLKGTIKMMSDLSLYLNPIEIEEIKNSLHLWCDFIPLQHSDRWYNVRIGCDNYSMIRISNHHGFNNA